MRWQDRAVVREVREQGPTMHKSLLLETGHHESFAFLFVMTEALISVCSELSFYPSAGGPAKRGPRKFTLNSGSTTYPDALVGLMWCQTKKIMAAWSSPLLT